MAPSPSPPQRRLSLSEKLLSPQEGIPMPDFPEPAQHPPPQSPSSARRPSLSERFFSRNGGAEYEDAVVIDSPTSATTGAEAQAGADGLPRRRLSISERLFHRSPSRHSHEHDHSLENGDAGADTGAGGRPRARRKSLSEKFLESQSAEGIAVPSPAPASPPDSDTAVGTADGAAHPGLRPGQTDEPEYSRPESPTPSEAIAPPQSRVRSYHPLALEVLVLLMPGSVFGVLARLGLTALDTYDGQGVFALAWVQGVGCLVMGACVGWRDQITAFHPPLYTAIATGFCGSLTSFSSWMLDVFLAFSNGYGYDRIWIYDIMDGLTRTFVTFAVSLCGLSLGLHIASYDLSHNRYVRRLGKMHISRPLRVFLVSASFAIYIITIPMYFVLSPRYRPLATSALLYSFPGTVIRHILGTQLNSLHPYIPLGTFIANALGTTFLAIFHAIQRLPGNPSSASAITLTSCVVLEGLIDGFCGCLSTVSTFAVEVRGMQGRGRQGSRAWAYAIGSWAVGQVLMVAILGGSIWGAGAREANWCVARLQES